MSILCRYVELHVLFGLQSLFEASPPTSRDVGGDVQVRLSDLLYQLVQALRGT